MLKIRRGCVIQIFNKYSGMLAQLLMCCQSAAKWENFLVTGDLGGGNQVMLIIRVGDKPEVQFIPYRWDVEVNPRSISGARRRLIMLLEVSMRLTNLYGDLQIER